MAIPALVLSERWSPTEKASSPRQVIIINNNISTVKKKMPKNKK